MPFLPFLSIVFVSSLFHLFISIKTLCMSELNDWMSSNRKAIIDVAYSFLSFELIYRMVYAKISANILGFLFCFFPIFFFFTAVYNTATQSHLSVWLKAWIHAWLFFFSSLKFVLSVKFVFHFFPNIMALNLQKKV